MARMKSTGTCSFCQGAFGKTGITRHLKTCKQRLATFDQPPGKGKAKGRKDRLFHLMAEGYPPYWIHFELPASAILADLDGFLRKIWLECCGHMSSFKINQTRYEGADADVLGDDDFMDFGGDRPRSMEVALGEALAPGATFYHEYDFGTTTELRLKVAGEREGRLRGKRPAVTLLARNDPPTIPCSACGKEATEVCAQCIWEGPEAWLCRKCARAHECDEEMFLPVVNSPRVGMCGYTG